MECAKERDRSVALGIGRGHLFEVRIICMCIRVMLAKMCITHRRTVDMASDHFFYLNTTDAFMNLTKLSYLGSFAQSRV